MELTHFTQQTFRTLMTCMSRPGTKEVLQKDAMIDGIYAETMSVLRTMLDGEVTFAVVGQAPRLQQEVMAWTGANVSEVADADFILVPQHTDEAQIVEAIQQAKVGDLVDPQYSATLIVEVVAETSQQWQLTGPGIQDNTIIPLAITPNIVAARAARNKEFPLGVDMIFVNEHGEVVALPRTTKAEGVEQ